MQYHEDAFANLTPTQWYRVLHDPLAPFSARDVLDDGELTRRESKQVAAAGELGRKIDFQALIAAQWTLAHAARTVQANLQAQPAGGLPLHEGDCAEGPIALEIELPDAPTHAIPDAYTGCQLVVGGPQPNTYDRDITLLVDLGGADTYHNNAGAWSPSAFACDEEHLPPRGGAAIAIDLGRGNDTYNATVQSYHGTQGSGTHGQGFLFDAGGNDTYVAREADASPCSWVQAQGSGLWGGGTLWDRGAGNDTYRSPANAQGVGRGGLGILLDEGGSDTYLGDPTFDNEGTQGMGCIGIGLLLDQGAEDDTYRTSGADHQGMGCLGAFGLLADHGGDDLYHVSMGEGIVNDERVLTAGWSQGYGELGAVGVLYDGSGNDTFVTEADRDEFRAGFLSQGAGLHGLGILEDGGSGDDVYDAGRRTQGGAQNSGAGILHDHGGDDVYAAHQACQGWSGEPGASAAGTTGLLLDEGGDDAYSCETDPDLGHRGDGHLWLSGRGTDIHDAPETFRGIPIQAHGGIGLDRDGRSMPPEALALVGALTKPPPDEDGDRIPDEGEPLACTLLAVGAGVDHMCDEEGEDLSRPSTEDRDEDRLPDGLEPWVCELTTLSPSVLGSCGERGRNYTRPELPIDPSPSLSDADGDHVPDDVEPLICAVSILERPSRYWCDDDGSNFTAPTTTDRDSDGVPDDLEPILCDVQLVGNPADGTCVEDGSDYRPSEHPFAET